MVTVIEEVTELVLIAKVAVVAPLATVTVEGTVAAAVLLLERVTTPPPAGAAEVNCTVPIVELPPTRLPLFNHMVLSRMAVMVKLELAVVPL